MTYHFYSQKMIDRCVCGLSFCCRIIGWCFLGLSWILIIVFIALASGPGPASGVPSGDGAIILIVEIYSVAFAFLMISGLCFLIDILAAILHGSRTVSAVDVELAAVTTREQKQLTQSPMRAASPIASTTSATLS